VREFPLGINLSLSAEPTLTLVHAKSTGKQERRLILAALFVILIAGVAALGHAVTAWSTRAAARKLNNPVPPSAEVVAAGMQTYRQHCQKCHGENGDGKGAKAAELSVAPGDFTQVAKMRDLTDGELFWEITKGRRPMPAFADKLSDQERWQVVDFIRTFAAPAAHGAPLQP
jgi:mono/diheme cytochrome c family protein